MKGWHAYASAGILALVGSPALWIAAIRWQEANGRATASNYFQSGKPPESNSLSNLPARRGFLQVALENGDNAQAFHEQEHRWSVELSRVRTRDAQDLFHGVLLPKLLTSEESAVLRDCVSLIDRWDVPTAISPEEREDLTEQIALRMLGSGSPDVLAPLANALHLLAQGDSRPRGELAAKLLDRLKQETGAQASNALLEGLIALEEHLDQSGADRLAPALATLLGGEIQSSRLNTWVSALKRIGGKLSPPVAGEVALQISQRLALEPDTGALRTLSPALAAVSPQGDANQSEKIADAILKRFVDEIEVGRLYGLLDAVRAVAPKVGAAGAQRLPLALSRRMEVERSPEILFLHASALGAFGPALPRPVAEQTAQFLLARMRETSSAGPLTELATGLAELKAGIPPATFEAGARILAARLPGNRNAHEVSLLASALSLLVEHIEPAHSAEFAEQVTGLMVGEHDPAVLLRLSTGVIAVAKRVDPARAKVIGGRLLARVDEETGSDSLRTLAFTLGSFGESIGEAQLARAGDQIASQMAGAGDPNVLRDLVSGLIALGDEVRAKHTADAASKLLRQLSLKETPDDLLNLSKSLQALFDRDDDEQEEASPAPKQAAQLLLNRILTVQDPSMVRSVSLALAPIDEILPEDAGGNLAKLLVERIAREPDADLQRALGEVLADLPAENLDQQDLDRVASVFSLPKAPCGIVLGAQEAGRVPQIARQLLNPMCSEPSWVALASRLGKLTKQPIVTGELEEDGALAYFHNLIVDDDDGESSTGEALEVHRLDVDFNKLSEVLGPLRADDSTAWSALQWLSPALFVAGLLMLGLAYRSE